MLLYSEIFGQKPEPQQPVIVFLHGLLGSGRDWRVITAALQAHYQCMTIDLPGHGFSHDISLPIDDSAIGFELTSRAIINTLLHRGVSHCILVGYSLGARLAMYLATLLANQRLPMSQKIHFQGVFLEGGHFGLPDIERPARWVNDQQWAVRFASQPLSSVLEDWYQQTVFSSLNHDQRQSLVIKRSDNLGAGIANMLLATSLAKQPLLLMPLQQATLSVRYVCGEYDAKFRQIAMQSELSISVIPDAGHNIHIEQPQAFISALLRFAQQA